MAAAVHPPAVVPTRFTGMLKRTALFEAHQQLGARLIDFGGWEMPVQYTSITEEHLAVRQAAGMFDISHMGEVTVSGAGAAGFLNQVLTNDIRRLTPGTGQYTLMCHENGGVIDDLYAYQLAEEVYLLIINASRVTEDVAWLQAQAAVWPGELRLTDASHQYAAIAVQGPRVREFFDRVITGPSISAKRVPTVTALKKNEIGGFKFEDHCVFAARTGYTGEDGFEVVGNDESIQRLWARCLAVGAEYGLKPAGLGARDTLRTEMGYPLYGHELDERTTPIEAGLGFFVALDKGEFNGRAVCAAQRAGGAPKRCVAFKMTGKSAPPRPQYPVWIAGQNAGVVVSGTQSPSLGVGIGLAYVPPGLAPPDTLIEIEIRGRRHPALTVRKPLYRRS